MRHRQVRRLVFVSAIATLVAVALMVVSILSPLPMYIVLAMSLGQLFGTLSLATYLLAIVLDLQGGGAGGAAAAGREGERREPAGS